MQTFPTLDGLLLNPAVAAPVVVLIVNTICYATGRQPTWLSLAAALVYKISGYLVTGRAQPDQLFLTTIHGVILVVPLDHVDANVLARLFSRTPLAFHVAAERQGFFVGWL